MSPHWGPSNELNVENYFKFKQTLWRLQTGNAMSITFWASTDLYLFLPV